MLLPRELKIIENSTAMIETNLPLLSFPPTKTNRKDGKVLYPVFDFELQRES